MEVPEYPALAPNVELLGEMEETGFRERQWLVRRGDRFIQLTELLYRVAEQADGQSTHEEMAEGLTRSTDRLVSAENVRQLLLNKLLPLGIILPAGGYGPQTASIGERHISPLRINARTRLLGPDAIDPITKVLQVLFAPVILVPILLTVGFAHGWLYLVHGLGGGMRDVLYAPGLIFAVLGVLFVSGIFHEFGHAAALRYGGGRVRGMGFGLYLVFPALYTDTTDNYRLGR
jgi:putative peptide zinc metalloprotease protein